MSLTPTLTTSTLISSPIQVQAWHTLSGLNLGPAPGYTGPAIQPVGAGWKIQDCTIRGFSVGIDTSLAKMEPDGTGEPAISGCRIYDCKIGINWDSISDGYITECVVANTVGHAGGEWINQAYQISTSTGLAGIRLGQGAGGVTVARCHVWGNFVHGILVWPSQAKILGCRVEGGRLALITMPCWNSAVIGTEVWNVLENIAAHGTKSPAIAAALQLGLLNEPGQLGYDPEVPAADYGAAQNTVELLVSNSTPMFPEGIINCDHENNNFLSLVQQVQGNSGPPVYSKRVPPGSGSTLANRACRLVPL